MHADALRKMREDDHEECREEIKEQEGRSEPRDGALINRGEIDRGNAPRIVALTFRAIGITLRLQCARNARR